MRIPESMGTPEHLQKTVFLQIRDIWMERRAVWNGNILAMKN